MSYLNYFLIALIFIPLIILHPVKVQTCVLPKDQMSTEHMYVLKTWRDDVLRNGDRGTMIIDGRSYRKSLDQTCLHCHSSKVTFCDSCHSVNSVAPNCWNCHNAPAE